MSALRLLVPSALALALSGCGGAQLEPQSTLPLAPAVTSAGETVYFGSVFPQNGVATQPTYVYERRVAEQPGLPMRSTHITRTPAGGVAIAEAATHSADYELRDYALYTNQLGQSGSIVVKDGRASFEVSNGEERRSAVESLSAPIVVGPTWVGYIVRHLPALRMGEVLPVRLAVLDRLETLGFELRALASDDPGLTTIEAAPSSFLIALAVDPLQFTFDTASGKLLRLTGRVPPKVWHDGWEDFDARVEYEYVAASYR